MASAAPRTDGRSEPGRPWVVGAVLLCAVGALGAVAKAAAPESLAGRAPGFADVFRINPGVVTVEAAVVVAAATIAGVAALWWSVRRSWPWLLVAGVALTFFAELAYPLHWTATTGDAAPFVQGTVTAGAHLVVLGTLGAGLVLVRIGAAGAVVLVTLLYLRYEGRPELAGPPDSEPAVGRLAALAGAAGALLFVPAAAIGDGGHGVTASWLLPAAGLAFSALAGPRAVAGTLVASAVVAGVSGPAGALIQTASIEPVRMWFWAALGRRAARPG